MNLKNLRNTIITFVAIISLAFIQSCNNDSTDNAVRVQLVLVDAPGDYLEVNVEIIDIQYNSSDSEDGWMSFTSESGYPINVDLTELIAGNSLLLTDQIIPSGMLKQIRLVLSDNNTLMIEGVEGLIPLDTPSAQQSGLKLNLNEELEDGFSYTFILDWNVQESVVEAGASGMFNLKPVIKVTAEVNSGSISGKVIEIIEEVETAIEDVTIMVYTTGDVLVTDTLTDIDGNFLIQGLESGSYIIKIARDGYQEYESAEIVVTVGNDADAGTIELLYVFNLK